VVLATQYYRPPFPDASRWRDDLQLIRETGLDAIGLWAVWAWIEAEPGRFTFDDFDELVEEAGRHDLQVVITAVAELCPYWIHRVVPGSNLVDHAGHPVRSTNLSYSHQALAPGGCIDHPRFRERQAQFLQALGGHFASRDNLLIWDCWNEIRWAVQTNGYVCFCDHTIASFRDWLRAKHGDLDGLNRAWRRRYADWEDVDPGRQPGGAWVETMEYLDFLAWRAAEHTSFRAEQIRSADPNHDVMAHSVVITPFHMKGESQFEQYLSRGNTFELARRVDAFGVSNFPGWFHTSAPEQGARIESARCSAGGRPLWISALQGGAASSGIGAMPPIPADLQQRWIWSSFGRGAKAVDFWCWRDEVFGRESSGFGVVGADGHARDRLSALAHTTDVLHEHGELLDAYAPADPDVAVLFEPANYRMEWSHYGYSAAQAEGSVNGYLLALERLQQPYDIVDASGPLDLAAYRVLIVPWAMIVRPVLAAALEDWVQGGGTLLVETETAAFDELGFFIYADERPLPRAFGFRGAGRRPIGNEKAVAFSLGEIAGELPLGGWVEPLHGADATVVAASEVGPIALLAGIGSGRVLALGTHAGLAYRTARSTGFETFIRGLLQLGDAGSDLSCSEPDGESLQWRFGHSGDTALLFVTNDGEARDVVFRGGLPASAPVADLLGAATEPRLEDGELRVALQARGAHLLAFRERRE
jgi:beta-galactosidase